MINNYAINEKNINYVDNNNLNSENNPSSFSNFVKTKYSFKTVLGQYFNIGDYGGFDSGKCGIGNIQKYGNILLDTDVENISEKQIFKTENPILDGGIIYNERISQKEFNFSIKIISKSRCLLENEIANIKRNLNFEGLKLIKKEFCQNRQRISELPVSLTSLEVSKFEKNTATVNFSFLSVAPNFMKPSGSSKSYRDISGNLNSTLIIGDTDVAPMLKTLINIKQLQGTITGIELEIDGYKIEIDTNISQSEVILFDGKNTEISVGNEKITNFKGKFMPFPINKPVNIKCSFKGGTVNNYSIYFSYDNIFR